MSAGNLFFLVCGVICLVGAIFTVAARTPIRSAMGLLATIIGIAGLFLELMAQFLAAIQLIVYAGAVVVLFVFVIMLIGADVPTAPAGESRTRWSRAVGGGLGAALALSALVFLGRSDWVLTPFRAARADHGTVEAVGGLLFSEGIVPFELATALLIVAVIGAIGVARSVPSAKQERVEKNPTRRMFAGPIAERGRGAPEGSDALAGESPP